MKSLVVHIASRYSLSRMFIDIEYLLETNELLWEGFCELYSISNLRHWVEAFGRERVIAVHTNALTDAGKVGQLFDWLGVRIPEHIPCYRVNENPYYPRRCVEQLTVYLLMNRLAGKKGIFWRGVGKVLATALKLSGAARKELRSPTLRQKIKQFAQEEMQRFESVLKTYNIKVIK